MGLRFADADYELRWPRWLFVQEASKLLNNRDRTTWEDACEQLLEDAFVGGTAGGPVADFRDVQSAVQNSFGQMDTRRMGAPGKLSDTQKFLRNLVQNAGQMVEGPAHRKPYWSQRKNGASNQDVGREATVRLFVALVAEFEEWGYFEKSFDKDCVDAPSLIDPSAVIEREIGARGVWPLQVDRLSSDLDLFCDVVEVLHDLVARPGARSLHSYAGCGWHYSRFSIESGRVIYRWRVNQMLERSELGLKLADDGEDLGRLIAPTDDARADLMRAMLERDTDEVGDQVRHAIALFRARGADKHEKRSAIVALGNVLEERRKLIRSELLKKDENDLFVIANKFSLRHQNESQQGDYDPSFLDWIFWWYLATIELTDRILAREGLDSGDCK